MNRELVHHEHERAVDQIVDEVSARVWRLREFVAGAAEHPDTMSRMRRAAALLVARMARRGPDAVAAADQVVAALWADDSSRPATDDWWTTPLGALVRHARSAAAIDLGSCPPITVAVTIDDQTVSIALAGELDLAAVTTVREAIEPHLGGEVVVDLERIEFMDSAGLTCLLALRRDATERGGHLSVGGASRAVRRLVQLAGLPATMLDR